MDDIKIPLYYTVRPNLTPFQQQQVCHALRITPVCCVIVTDPRYTELALALGPEIVYAPPPSAAHSLARSLDQPCVVIGGNSVFEPIFEDVHEEAEKESC